MSAMLPGVESSRDVLSWMHIRNLLLTDGCRPNHRYLQALVSAANNNLTGATDFTVLLGTQPGPNWNGREW
jgi:hypothetical protein